MPTRRLTAALLPLIFCTAALAATDWPHLRGPELDGRAPAEVIAGAEAPGLEVGWRIPLGSGYSGIAVAAGRAVTMFTEGDSDWVAAFDLDNGSELWRHRLDSVNRGRDGSADGPISSPVIGAGAVYALGPKGQLVALDLEDGELRWSRRMDRDFGATEPDFGFGATPLLVDGKLVVLTGVEGGAVTALDAETGETLWASGTDEYQYQVPVVTSAGETTQILVSSSRAMIGVDPQNGAELWSYEAKEGEQIGGTITLAGEDRFLVQITGESVMLALERGDDGFSVRELYRTRELGGTYALPVYYDGHLYGYRGQILACVDAETGERLWRSRPPGGRGLILVGDKLALFAAAGHVVLADASPEGYVERARIKALDVSGYTWPSYADGRILVRNLEEMAAVTLGGGSPTAGEARTAEVGGEFGRFLESLDSAPDKAAAIEGYLEAQESLPIVEGERVHFVYYGEAEDVAIQGTMTAAGGSEAMARVAGTDFFHRSYTLEPGGRWEYRYVRDYGERIPDPRNPRGVPARQGGGQVSELYLPGYEPAEHVAEREDGAKGTLEEVRFESEILGLERLVTVYLPHGYGDSDRSYPLLVVHDGADWLEKGLMANTLDNLIGSRIRPVVVAFLKARDEWWLEAGGTATAAHVDMLTSELVPLLEERYRLEKGPESRALMGNTGWGLTSAYAALRHPDLFGKVAIQSPMITLGFEDALLERLDTRPRPDIEFYLDWSRYEVRNLDAGIDLTTDSRRLAEALRAAGYEYAGGEVLDSAGWSGWRSRTDRILETFFPLR